MEKERERKIERKREIGNVWEKESVTASETQREGQSAHTCERKKDIDSERGTERLVEREGQRD